ncbi:MAG: NAD-dependent epimerase/dehydratase family protein [Simkaniaceae bacterium]|nr:NAD-dependent epimerase/dehydratase family protein [Simkaniaceae bacterium]
MKVLITGSEGLIGSALSTTLIRLGISAFGFDNKLEPHHPHYGDILNHEQVTKAMQDVEGVVHLAAVSRVVFGEKNPKLCWDTNVEGTKNILEAALASPKKPWVLYASSREVYGQQEELPVKETAPLIPVNIYGDSKIAAERAVAQATQRGLKAAVVRFSNVFGRICDHPDRVIPAFCLAAAYGTKIRIDGKDNLFDFTYIEDVVQGILSFLYHLSHTDASLPPIHFTTGEATSLGKAASFAQQASKYPIEIVEAPSRNYDVARFYGDPSRAETLLHWKPCVGVQEGMRRLIHQYQLASHIVQGEHAIL